MTNKCTAISNCGVAGLGFPAESFYKYFMKGIREQESAIESSIRAWPPCRRLFPGTFQKINNMNQPVNETPIMKKRTLLTAVVLIVAATCVRAGDVKENFEKNCVKCHGADGKG